MPDDYVLTADEAEELMSQGFSWPEEGLIYDGTAYPGTEFTNVAVTGIEVEQDIVMVKGGYHYCEVTITPEEAYDVSVTCTSDDTSIVAVTTGALVYGVNTGTTTLTFTSTDGQYQTTCNITVVEGLTLGDYICELNADGTVTIANYTGYDFELENYDSLVIPSEIEGYKVTAIGDAAYYVCEFLDNIYIPEGITSIGAYAFAECYDLWYVRLPNSLTEIGAYAFYDCWYLNGPYISLNVDTIGDYAFCETSVIEIFYSGNEDELGDIKVGRGNNQFLNAYIRYVDLYTLGDANLDGEVDYLDAMMVLRYDAALMDLDDTQFLAGDVNGDGYVNTLDAILILRYDAGLIDSFE